MSQSTLRRDCGTFFTALRRLAVWSLLLGGAPLSSIGFPQEEVVALIDETRSPLYSKKMMGLLDGLEPGPLAKLLEQRKRRIERVLKAGRDAEAAVVGL